MPKENAGQFQLSPEAAQKIGLNEETATELVEKINQEEGKDKTEPAKDAMPEKATSVDDKPVEGQETPDKTGQPTPPENKPPENKVTEAKPNPFHEKVIENLTRLIDDEDDAKGIEKQEKFLKDLENYEKFQASNTTEAMKNADIRKEIEALSQHLGSKEILETVETIIKREDLKDFLESADNWFDEQEADSGKSPDQTKNPIRGLLSLLIKKTPENKIHAEETRAISEKEAQLNLKTELLDLYEVEPEYKKNETTLMELATLADSTGVNLLTAHKIRSAETLSKKTEELNGTIKTLNEKISNLEKELKTATQKKPGKPNEYKPGVIGNKGGPTNFRQPHLGKPDFEGTRAKLIEKLGAT